jgi:predicted DNA-binding antitoxin AbrB/MazE fold protein
MTTTAAAIYENGVLGPLSPLPLAEGTRVEVTVREEALPSLAEISTVAGLLGQIAALPMESKEGSFSGRDHDRALYGPPATKP